MDDAMPTTPLHPTLLSALVTALDEPRLVDHRPPRRARSLRARRRPRST